MKECACLGERLWSSWAATVRLYHRHSDKCCVYLVNGLSAELVSLTHLCDVVSGPACTQICLTTETCLLWARAHSVSHPWMALALVSVLLL